MGRPPAAAKRPSSKTENLPMPSSSKVVVAPAGTWGEEMARQLVDALARAGKLKAPPVKPARQGAATVVAFPGDILAKAPGGPDVVLAATLDALDPEAVLGLAAPGSTVVVHAQARDVAGLVAALAPGQRKAILDRKLRLHWVDAERVASLEKGEFSDQAFGIALVGAAVAALRGASNGAGKAVAAELAGLIVEQGQGMAARFLREAVELAQAASTDALAAAAAPGEVDFQAGDAGLVLPNILPDPNEQIRWRARLRAFYAGSQSTPAAPGPEVIPAGLSALIDAQGQAGHGAYPFVLTPAGGATPLAEHAALADAPEIVTDNVDALTTLLATTTDSGVAPAADALRGVAAAFVARLDVAGDRAQEATAALEALAAAMGPDAVLVGLGPATAPALHVALAAAARAQALADFVADLDQLRERLKDVQLLDLQHSAAGQTASTMTASLGATSGARFDASALAAVLPKRKTGGVHFDQARTARVAKALEAIDAFLAAAKDRPPVLATATDPNLAQAAGLPADAVHKAQEPLSAAVALFEDQAAEVVEVVRAARIARLEVDHSYRPEVHDAGFARLDWQGLAAHELDLVPAILAFTTGADVRAGGLAPLSETILSSRPVQVLVLDEAWAPDEAADPSRYHASLGDLAMAHREAFVLESSLAQPEVLVQGLSRLVRARRPAVAVIRQPTAAPAAWRPLRAEAALLGRACPELVYDPDAGASWAERLDLTMNPSPELVWPRLTLGVTTDGAVGQHEIAFTWGDGAVTEPAYEGQLRVVPPTAWADDQIPLDAFLALDDSARADALPYVWVVDRRGQLGRAVVTRALAFAAADRMAGWRQLQELGGYNNVFAREAAERARAEAEAAATERLAQREAELTEEIEQVREETAREALSKLAAVIAGLDTTTLGGATASRPAASSAAAPAAAAAEAPVAEAEAPAEAPTEDEDDDAGFGDPYIDTFLCTSCNECVTINPGIFKYNGDKQAFIDDPTMGTFAELVRAAKGCPARIIHPGKPREGDSSATPEILELAAKFN